MTYYLAGYYLVRLQPVSFGSTEKALVHSCSTCINDSLLEAWSYSWTTGNNEQIEAVKRDYLIGSDSIESIRKWVDDALDTHQIGWLSVFMNIESVRQYKQTFFSHLLDLKMLAIYLDENGMSKLVDQFRPQAKEQGAIGIYEILSIVVTEQQGSNEKTLGFDLIGVEIDGNFHSFHCHDLYAELASRFGLKVNTYGLLEDISDWQPIVEYMNEEKNGFEPVPWVVVKVKLIGS